MPSSHILLVGHGYLGAHLAEELHRAGHSVVAMHRGEASRESYSVVSGDVTSADSVRRAVASFRPTAIVHCASSGRGGAEAYRSIFLDGLDNLQTIFPGIPVVFTSSTSVYGQTDGSVVDESSETLPGRDTGQILLAAEKRVRIGGGIALRLAGIYGPGRSVYLKQLLEGSAKIEDVEPSRFLNQIHRNDAAGAILHLLRTGIAAHRGGLYNVVDDSPVTQRQCYEELAAFFDLPIPPLAPPDPDRKRGWTHKIVSNAKLRATGWEPRFSSFLAALTEDPVLVPSIRDLLT